MVVAQMTNAMLSGAYSAHFRNLQDNNMQDLHEIHHEERVHISTKAKKLQTETNRRRKAIAIKRKLEAQKEEKRRQDILAKRREAQREATERFQRGSRPIRNRVSSAGSIRYHQPVPTLEDALFAARGSSGQRDEEAGTVHRRTQSAKVVREVQSEGRNAVASKPVTQTELHNKSLRNLNNSRSLFEQQLEQHQQLLMEHQQQTLANFNQAIQKEIDEDQRLQGVESYYNDDNRLSRSASLSSLDSLEEESNKKSDVATEMKQHMDSVSKLKREENSFTGLPVYQPHPPANPPPRNVSPRSHALLQHTNSCSSIPVSVSSYAVNGASSKPVVPIPSTEGATVAVPRYNSPLQRSHSSPTIGIVQPNNAQVSDDMEEGTVQHYNNDRTAVKKHPTSGNETTIKSTYQQLFPEKESADQSQRREAGHPASGHALAHNQTYTVGMATVTPPYTSTAYSISKSNYEISNRDGARPYIQTGAWEDKTNHVNNHTNVSNTNKAHLIGTGSDGNKTHVGNNNINSCTAKQLTSYTNGTASNRVQVNDLTYSTYGVTPPSTQNLLNAIENMSNALPKTQVPSPSKPQVKSEPEAQETRAKGQYQQKSSNVEPEEESDTASSEEETKTTKRKEIKGILKKNLGNTRGRNMGVKGLRVNISTGASVRDSLEVTREHQHRPRAPTKRCKKSVRFSDLEYDDGTTDMIEELGEDPLEYNPPASSPREESNTNALSGGQKKYKLRPFSAKVSTTTPPVDPNLRAPRVASAGNARRGPFVRPHPPPGKPQLAFRANQYSNVVNKADNRNGNGKLTVNTWSGNNISPNQNQNNSAESAPVYDANGLRLDRTPTDDEINWLWEKVRTCLNRTPSADGTEAARNNETRKSVSASQKLIDGNSLAPQFQTSARISNGTPASNGGIALQSTTQAFNKDSTSTYPKRTYKISMDKLNTYSQRSNQGRNQGEAPSRSTAGPQISYSAPKQSQAGQTTNVTESMAGFLAAEKLAEQSMAESDIERAIQEAEKQQQAFNAARPAHNADPSTLSIEEQRLKQSLDRLNERLRAISDGAGVGPTGMFVPRPPTYQYGSFRGHHPKSAPRSYGNKPTGGSLARHTATRGHSATGGRHVYAGHTRH